MSTIPPRLNGRGAPSDVVPPLKAQSGQSGKGDGAPLVYDARGNGDGELVPTMVGDHMNRVTDYTPVVTGAMSAKWAKGSGGPAGDEAYNLVSPPLGGGQDRTGRIAEGVPNPVIQGGVRRLTPTECERLQGFPDGWTAGQSDTQRYKMLGNAVCVPVAEWIARRIMRI